MSAFVLGSNDKIPSFSRQVVADEFALEGNPRDFKDFQSYFGFPILSLSFPITKFFFLSFIIRWTLFRDFIVFIIAVGSGLF